MRYKEVHTDNLIKENNFTPELLEALDTASDYGTLFHAGALTGKALAHYQKEYGLGCAGCEAYPMAKRYAKKRGVVVTEDSSGVADKSFDVVLVDIGYPFPIEEAVRIARVAVICPLCMSGDNEVVDNLPCQILNDHYEIIRVNSDEDSDSEEE